MRAGNAARVFPEQGLDEIIQPAIRNTTKNREAYMYTQDGQEMTVLSTILFDLKEDEESTASWDKETVRYMLSNRRGVESIIRSTIKKNRLQRVDVEDVFQDLLMDMYKKEDFNEYMEDGIKNIFRFIAKRLEFIMHRYTSEYYEEEKHRVDNVVKYEDDEELTLLDTVAADNTAEKELINRIEYEDISSFIEAVEHKRHIFGFDLFQVLYIYLKLHTSGVKEDDIWNFISVITKIERKIIKDSYSAVMADNNIRNAITAMVMTSVEDGINVIGEYIYGRTQLDKTLKIQFSI